MIEWVNFINKAYINLAAPLIKVFKLDKIETPIDTLYGEEQSSRIYLPPFDMRAFHLDLYYKQLLGTFAIEEQEEQMQFVCNFEDMVQRVRDVKNTHITDMYITYSGDGVPAASKTNTNFILKKGGSTLANYDLTTTDYNTTKKLGTAINTVDDFTVTLQGSNDSSVNIVNFNNTTFKGETLLIYSLSDTYQNITDVIENGDVILTNKWRLYEVQSAQPAGDFAWSYVTWRLDCGLVRLDSVDLPGDYNEQIEEHQYGVKDKIDIEARNEKNR